ncbi:hypothetical protein ACYULU_09815 [Breznakiellaceae bacterium SP9]
MPIEVKLDLTNEDVDEHLQRIDAYAFIWTNTAIRESCLELSPAVSQRKASNGMHIKK